MKIYWIIMCGFLLGALKAAAGVQEEKETFLFAVRGTDSLYLDKYEGYGNNYTGNKPCILFMFGGGFAAGQRDADNYRKYFKYLNKQGYTVISLDYRLGLKGIKSLKEKSLEEVVTLITKSVEMAVEDLYAATNFVLSKADEWHIDVKNIITNGSSAGAIAALQAEYWICNGNPLAAQLPAKFNYAGVISFAGAIFEHGNTLQWKEKPAPVLLFHGSADDQVPYAKVGDEKFSVFGSAFLAEQLTALQVPHYFYNVKNAAHELAVDPMYHNRDVIDIFLDQIVRQKEPLIMNTNVWVLGQKTLKKDLEISDYIH